MREVIKNMSPIRKVVFADFCAIIITALVYIIAYAIARDIKIVAVATLAVADVAAFAAFAAAFAATAAFAVFAFAVHKEWMSFWKAFVGCLLQTLMVYIIFAYMPYMAIPVLCIYVLGILYLLVFEPKIIADLKANSPFVETEEATGNGVYRTSTVSSRKIKSKFRLWLYKLVV